MPKRRGRKPVKKAISPPPRSPPQQQQQHNSDTEEAKEQEIEDKEAELLRQDVERKSAAVRAIRDVEIDHILSNVRVLRSYFKEQLQNPVLQVFKENLPNLSIVKNEENGQLEVQWNDVDCNLSMDNVDARDIHASLLRRMSMAFPYSSAVPSFGGYEFSSKSVKTRLLGADNRQITDFVLEDPSDSQMFGLHNALQTPGATSQRLSFGMTPKTLRPPKAGEMLLSVHGSPLGVYKEDNMEAINEAEEDQPPSS